MHSTSVALVFFLVLIGTALSQSYQYRSIGSFQSSEPGFLNIGYFNEDQRKANISSMTITSFSGRIFSTDTVHIIEDLSQYSNNVSGIVPTLVTDQLIWPNEAIPVPFDVFGKEAIGVGNGFLVPGKSTGQVSVIFEGESSPSQISATKKGWFYHITLWWDMNGDGLTDCVTARATVPTVGTPQGQLVWFEHPTGSNPFASTWTEHVLGSGPDIMVHFIELEPTMQPQIVASQFFSNELTLWWTTGSTWAAGPIQNRVIDSTLGSPFDSQFIDLNNDGKDDLLVTNHESEATESAVFAYTVPDNWQTDPWPRYTLATNITTLRPGNNQASPGYAAAFHPQPSNPNQKRWILVGGDGAEVAFLLIPNSQDPDDWTYTRQDIINVECTVGQVAVADIDGNGYSEFFIPAFERKTVYGYTFTPDA